MANKKDEVVEQKAVVEEQPIAPIKYFNLDEFLANRKEKLSQEIANGFRVFLKGRLYQLSLEAFEKELTAFHERFKKD